MTQKQSLINLLNTSQAETITLIYKNLDMVCPERITIHHPDFKYKAKYIENVYDDSLRIKRNPRVQIVGVQISEFKGF